MFLITCQIFLFIFSFTKCLHFLGGSFTYKHIPQKNLNHVEFQSILVEIRFHMSNHFFLCTSEQINEHMIAYLIGENVPYDNRTKKFLWNEIIDKKGNPKYYDIKCFSKKNNSTCQHFTQQIWAFCESANRKSGYSILKRRFLLIVQRFAPLNLYYSACCWASTSNKNFHFNLSIETYLSRNNSSPYPHIPASYYVAFNKSNRIKIFAFDADGDEILCAPYREDLSGFLSVYVDEDCTLNYKIDRLGKQYGQFWLMDRYGNHILSHSLISVQVHVLENIICDRQPELILNEGNNTNKAVINMNESIDIFVRLHPNCPLIKPADQTITELTTLCANNQPIILSNGGIEVLFQCQLSLCELYQICFVGEIGRKLPATNIECFSIKVTGSRNECFTAASEYDFSYLPNRHFITAEPIAEILNETQLSSESHSESWLWVLFAHIAFLLIGIIIYCSCKQMLSICYNHSLRKQSNRIRIRTVTEPHPLVAYRNTRPSEPLLPKYEHVLSKEEKARVQYLRLGSVDRSNK